MPIETVNFVKGTAVALLFGTVVWAVTAWGLMGLAAADQPRQLPSRGIAIVEVVAPLHPAAARDRSHRAPRRVTVGAPTVSC